MSFINYMAREINCKIVYYGPGLCGKTTNLQYIYKRTNPDGEGQDDQPRHRRRSARCSSTSCRWLWARSAASRRASTCTRCPGQVFYDASRKLILKGVDGVVFVADSQIDRTGSQPRVRGEPARRTSPSRATRIDKLPYVIQYNKRDLPNVVPWTRLRSQLQAAAYLTSGSQRARRGTGVFRGKAKPSSKLIYRTRLPGRAAPG